MHPGQLSDLVPQVVHFDHAHSFQQGLVFQIVEELEVALELLPAYAIMQPLANEVPSHVPLQHHSLLLLLHSPDLGQNFEASVLPEVLLDHPDGPHLEELLFLKTPENSAHSVVALNSKSCIVLNLRQVLLQVLVEHGLLVHAFSVNLVDFDALLAKVGGHAPLPLFRFKSKDAPQALLLPVLRSGVLLPLDSGTSGERVVSVHAVHEALAEMRALLVDKHGGLPYWLVLRLGLGCGLQMVSDLDLVGLPPRLLNTILPPPEDVLDFIHVVQVKLLCFDV